MSRVPILAVLLLTLSAGNARAHAQSAGTPVLISREEIPVGSGAAAEAPNAASSAAPEVGTGCLLLFDSNRGVAAGRWRVGAVIRSMPCEKAQIRPGSVAIFLGGKKAKDFTAEDVPEFERGGAIGSAVELEVLEGDGEVRKVVLTRAAIPESGTVDVILPDGQTVKSATFGGHLPLSDAVRAAAKNSEAPTPSPGALPSERTCRGVAAACSSRNSVVCTLGSGCIQRGNCSGASTQTTCPGRDQYSCATTPGCVWMARAKSCTGMGQSCFGQDAAACNSIRGCTWTSTCTGVATPCSSLDGVHCPLQPGCSFR